MAEINLTQKEADLLIALEKHRMADDRYEYPGLGGAICISLQSKDKREKFLLDISRSRIDLKKGKYQERGREVVVLVRLDFGNAPHRNPDGVELKGPHLHLYKEGYGDKWAIPAPMDKFPDFSDLYQVLDNFMNYCNITEKPIIDKGLFS